MTARNLKYNVPVQHVPPYMITKHIVRGYRIGGTYKQCLQKFFTLHNEAINAWTMFVSAFFVLFSSIWFLNTNNVNISNTVPFISYVLAYWIHLPFSVGYHTFMPISKTVHNLWRKMDVYGIFTRSVLMTFATSFFVFPIWGTCLSTFTSLIVAIWGMQTFSKMSSNKPLNKLKQAIFVGVSVMCYYLPFCVSLLQNWNSFWIVCYMTLSILFGGVCYSFGIPERFSPGTFDLLFNSHIILHLGLICSSICEFLFLEFNYHTAQSKYNLTSSSSC